MTELLFFGAGSMMTKCGSLHGRFWRLSPPLAKRGFLGVHPVNESVEHELETVT